VAGKIGQSRIVIIPTREIDVEEEDRQLYALATYLTTEVCPRIFKRDANACNIPLVVSYRLFMTLLALVICWLFLMFEPQNVRVSLFDVIKSRTNLFHFFMSPCGFIAN